MSKKLSFAIAINLLTENFKKGANSVKNHLRSIQMQVITFAAALGAGGLGLSGLLSRFKDVAVETSRVQTALKNVSDGTRGFADNLRFVNDIAAKYGLQINVLTGNFAKFTASATQANMPMEQQKKVFESLSRASTAFGLSADETNGVFLALSQMMGKGKISSEELRKQMGEKLPVAMQAMAKAAGVSMGGLEKLLKKGKLMSADIIPKFADALNEMIPNVDTDNLSASLARLSNAFNEIVNSSGFQSKYKALIDWLTSALQSAGKNIQNIVIGIVAAIGFAVTAGLTKTYRGYAATGQQIIGNATTTHNKLRAAIAARVEAEKNLESLKLQHAQAVGAKQISLQRQIDRAKQTLSARTAAVKIAHENAKAAAAQAAAIKSRGAWANAFAVISGAAKKLGAAIKSMWNSFAPAFVISAIIGIVGHLRSIYNESKRIKNIYSDYRKKVDSLGDTQEIKMLQAQLAIMNDKTKSEKEINAAQNALQKKLGVEKKSQKDINKLVEKRIELLRAAAEADLYAQEAAEYSVANKKLTKNAGLTKDQMESLVEKRKESKESGKRLPFANEVARVWKKNTGKDVGYDVSAMIDLVDEYIQNSAVISDAESNLKKELHKANKINSPKVELDDKEKKDAERRLEALRKMNEEERRLKLEKKKFDLEMEQKGIDILDDSFEKRTKQTLLNLKKEELAVEEMQANLLKKQKEYAQEVYASTHGTDKIGFEDYFAGLNKANFKDKNGVDIMPEGLRPEDIQEKVTEMLAAARKAKQKAKEDITKDISTALKEQELMFASSLDKKLAEADAYYNDLLVKAAGNTALIAQIEANRGTEKAKIKADDTLEKIDFQEELEQERLAGMESIGMTELVESKKLEITRKYIQQRIDAIKPLAQAGDEGAKQQLEMLEASLAALDVQKPVKGLKALADKAIFDTIKNGFIKAGDSAEEAEEKTIKLLGTITQKAAMIAGIASELKSVFGGMDEGLDAALDAVGNIASGFAQGGIVGGAMAIIGEGMKLFSKASEVAAKHQKALKEVEEARLASQRAYNLLLHEQNLLLEEAVSIFGEKQIKRAANALETYQERQKDLKNEMQGGFQPDEAYEQKLQQGAAKGGITGMFSKMQLAEYRKNLENYNKGISQLGNAQIVTGSKTSGALWWKKQKDVYSSISAEYDDILNDEGKLNKARIQNILDTRKMSDETRNYLQNLISLTDAAEAAQQELSNYLQATFGSLGEDIMTSLESAIRDKGVDAWEAFGEAGSKVLEQLGKQLAYELFFADKFKDLQEELKGIYGSGKSEEEIATDAMNLIGDFYKNIEKDMELAQGFMENWQKEAEKNGMSAWASDDSHTQDSTKGYSVSMDQDTGGAILGRITGIQEAMLQVKSMLGAVNMDTTKNLTASLSIGEELKKHTGILYELQQVQIKSYRKIEAISEGMGAMTDIKASLEQLIKNTKNL